MSAARSWNCPVRWVHNRSLYACRSLLGVALYVENPDAMLKMRPFMRPYTARLATITYCMYGALWMKRTNVWSWNSGWQPAPVCTMSCPSCAATFAATGKWQHQRTLGQDQSYSRQAKCLTPYLLTHACLLAATLRGLRRPWDLDLMCGANHCTRAAR